MDNPPRTVSPFLPLQLLVLILGIWIGNQLVTLNQERLDAEAQIQQVIPQANAALNAKKRLLALAEDVGQLAAKDANAAEISKEFDIRLSPEPSPAAK